MRRTIAPFADEHLDQAAALLAARHRADRAHEPVLPARFEGADQVREQIAALRSGGATGVVALAGGRLAGYLIGNTVLPAPTSMWSLFIRPRSARVGYAGHAVAPNDGSETYRELYAALAPVWLSVGCFSHYVDVAAADEAANAAWFSLGFGEDIAATVRETGPVAGAERAPAIEVHRAGAEDIEVVMRLAQALMRHHAGSPILFPYLPETEADQRTFQLAMLTDPAKPNFVAYQDGKPVAMQTFLPDVSMGIGEMLTPDRCVYLFQGFTEAATRGGGVGTALLSRTMAWAREQDFDYCTLNFLTANLSGARFWQRHGFRVIENRLCRHIDDRIAWANGRAE